jgi:hypothetical protein
MCITADVTHFLGPSWHHTPRASTSRFNCCGVPTTPSLFMNQKDYLHDALIMVGDGNSLFCVGNMLMKIASFKVSFLLQQIKENQPIHSQKAEIGSLLF